MVVATHRVRLPYPKPDAPVIKNNYIHEFDLLFM
jgi:hypothetical protein